VLILMGAREWFSWASAVLSVGALIAFALSRTISLFGFPERGWNPSPYAALSVIAEALTVVLGRRVSPREPQTRQKVEPHSS